MAEMFGIRFTVGRTVYKKWPFAPPIPAFLNHLALTGRDFRPFFQNTVKPAVVREIKGSFAGESESPGGSPWTFLSQDTRRIKDKRLGKSIGPFGKTAKYGSDVIGRQTDVLYRALTVEKALGNESIITDKSFKWGANLDLIPYAKRFFYGYRTQPPRPLRFWTERVRAIVHGGLKKRLADLLGNSLRIVLQIRPGVIRKPWL